MGKMHLFGDAEDRTGLEGSGLKCCIYISGIERRERIRANIIVENKPFADRMAPHQALSNHDTMLNAVNGIMRCLSHVLFLDANNPTALLLDQRKVKIP